MSEHIFWRERPLAFCAGDTVAMALLRAGVVDLGAGPAGSQLKVLCGIGQCQACLVRDARGQTREACLAVCVTDAHWQPWADAGQEHQRD